MSKENYPVALQKIVDAAQNLFELANKSKNLTVEDKEFNVLLKQTITNVGISTNSIIEDPTLDHSLCYNAINKTIYKIKQTINLIPQKSLESKINILSIFSLSMFLINTLFYYADEKTHFNTICLLLSELLTTSSLFVEDRTFLDEFKTIKRNKFIVYQQFCESIVLLIENVILKTPTIAEEDFILWCSIATDVINDYWKIIKDVNYDIAAEKDLITGYCEKNVQKNYLSIYIHVSALLNMVTLIQTIAEAYYFKISNQPKLIHVFGKNVHQNFIHFIANIENKIHEWLTGIEEDYTKGVIPEENKPENDINFVTSKLGHKLILFMKKYIEQIFACFSPVESESRSRNIHCLTELIQVGEDFLFFSEKVFQSKENIIKTPYGGIYIAILQKIAALSQLLAIDINNTQPIQNILDKYGTVFNILPTSKFPKLFITRIILDITVSIIEANEKHLQEIVKLIKKAKSELTSIHVFEHLTLSSLEYVLRLNEGVYDDSELNSDIVRDKELLNTFVPHLEEKYNQLINILFRRTNNKIIKDYEIIPYDYHTWFFPPFQKLQRIKTRYPDIHFESFNFLPKRNKIVEEH